MEEILITNPITPSPTQLSTSLPSTQASSPPPPPTLTSAQLDLLYGQTLSVIIPDELYLSDYQAALDEKLLKLLGITHIVNASNGTVPNQFPDLFRYYNVNVEDEDEAEITPYFNLVEEFLHPQQEESDQSDGIPKQQQLDTSISPPKILFHCRLGISRSPALVMAHLMKTRGMSLREAYEKTKLKRSKIQPGLTFCKALLEYERVVFPSLDDNSITIQALCGGNQRYSIVSRQSAASIQRQSSIGEMREKSGSASSSKSNRIHETDSEQEEETTAGPVSDNERGSLTAESGWKSHRCCCCCVM